MANQRNLREIYDLLDKLSRKFSPDRHKDILKKVTTGISESQHGFVSNVQFDESIILAKIKSHLASKSQSNHATFLNLHEQLTTLTEPKFRSSILTFLLSLSDIETKLPNTLESRDSNGSTFMLPVRNQASTSASMEQIYRTSTSRNASMNSLNSDSGSNSNLRLVNFRRKIPTSASTDSVLDSGQTPDSEYSFINQNLSVEDEIVQEAIYSLTGKSVKYLKKDVSGDFKLDVKARSLSSLDSIALLKIAESGRLHNEIQKYTDSTSEFFFCGLFGQGLIAQIQAELTQYYGLVAHLQDNLNNHRSRAFTENNNAEILTLLKLLAYLSEPQQRLRLISEILQECKNLKGGQLASALHKQLYDGDSTFRGLVESFLKATCRPLQTMLGYWLIDGEIKDPHKEFFVEEINDVSSDRLWHHKYRVVASRLPSYISKMLGHKILVSGKSINFLREVCEDKTPIKGREELRSAFDNNIDGLFKFGNDSKLHELIDQVYLNTSQKVLEIAMGQYRLMEHLHSMRKYLLLGQGDFIGLLMENLKDELDRPAKDLYQHALFSIVASSIRATLQIDESEVLKHLDVKLVHAIDGDRGWDIFTLQYTVHGPLATILEPNMGKYQELFKPLWKAKHVEFVLNNIWKEQMLNSKTLRSLTKTLNPVTYRLHLYTSEMIHFVNQMQYYTLFEVIECSWSNFTKRVQNASALDDILAAHEDFLNEVRVGTFLDSTTKDTLYLHLDIVYDSIMKLEEWQRTFYDISYKERMDRKKFEEFIEQSEKSGIYGVTTEKRLERDQEQKMFEQSISTLKKTLDGIGQSYEKSVNAFLFMLNSSKDQNLQLFGTRLDFNEYYKNRDQRLKKPLTYEHMRLSGMGHSGIFTRNGPMIATSPRLAYGSSH